MSHPWPLTVRLADLSRGAVSLVSEPSPDAWPGVAAAIGVDAISALKAEVSLKPWLDGAEIQAAITANVVQTCGVTLDAFTAPLEARFTVHVLPRTSRHAPATDERELSIDPEGEDPPDLIDTDVIDVGAYLVEHLALEVDPFPRKPDAVFEQKPEPGSLSPFAGLAVLKTSKAEH